MSVERHTPRVSVIIPTWNRSAELRTCLQALDLQEVASKEVILADDGSTDGTCQMVENESPRVRLIRGTERLGPSARRNEAIGLAQGEFLLFLDSDITFPTPAETGWMSITKLFLTNIMYHEYIYCRDRLL
jgi:glycosyltransferase involved in cell wall biosynthesis